MKKYTYLLGALVVIILIAITFKITDTKPSQQVAVGSPHAATVGIVSISKSNQTAAVVGSFSRSIAWQTSGFPTGASVNIDLIQKTSDSPATYVLVRKIASNIPNNGQYLWTPTAGDQSENNYVEVTCSTSNPLNNGCEVTSGPLSTS